MRDSSPHALAALAALAALMLSAAAISACGGGGGWARVQIPFKKVDALGDPVPKGAVGRLGSARYRHPGQAEHLALSADGTRLALTYKGDGAAVFELATGREIKRVAAGQSLGALALSSSGDTLAAVVGEASVRVWTLLGGDPIALEAKGAVQRLAFSPDDAHLAVGWAERRDEGLQVHATSDGALATRLVGGKHLSGAAWAFTPDAGHLVVQDERHIVLRETVGGKRTKQLTQHDAALLALQSSTDGRRIWAVDEDLRFLLVDVQTGMTVRLQGKSSAKARRTLVAPGGEIGARVVGDGRSVEVWSLKDAKRTVTLEGAQAPITDLAFGPGASTLAAVDGASAPLIWDVATGAERVGAQGPRVGVAAVALAPMGPHAATLSDAGELIVWDVLSGKIRWRTQAHKADRAAWALAFSSDGRRLATSSEDRFVRVWDVEGDGSAPAREFPRYASHLAFGDANLLYFGHKQDIHAVALGAVPAEPERLKRMKRSIRQLEVVVLGVLADRVILDPSADTQLGRFRLPKGRVTHLATTPDGARLVAHTKDGVLHVVEGEARKEIRELTQIEGEVSKLKADPSSKKVAVATPAGVVQLIDLDSGEATAFEGHRGAVRDLAFSADGRVLASAGADGVVLFWPLVPVEE